MCVYMYIKECLVQNEGISLLEHIWIICFFRHLCIHTTLVRVTLWLFALHEGK